MHPEADSTLIVVIFLMVFLAGLVVSLVIAQKRASLTGFVTLLKAFVGILALGSLALVDARLALPAVGIAIAYWAPLVVLDISQGIAERNRLIADNNRVNKETQAIAQDIANGKA